MEEKLSKPLLQKQLLKSSPIPHEGSAAWHYPLHGGSAQGCVSEGLHQEMQRFLQVLICQERGEQLQLLESKSPPREGRWDGGSRGVTLSEAPLERMARPSHCVDADRAMGQKLRRAAG